MRGRLERRDIEGGTWILHARQGDYVLLGNVPRHLEGQEVEVDGDEVEGFGIAMMGRQLEVRSIRRV